MTTDNTGRVLVSAWKARNAVYEGLLGQYTYSIPRGNVTPVPAEPDLTGFKLEHLSKRVTVLAYAPSDNRPHWTYITHGLSNPSFQSEQNEVSGFGCELMVKSATDARWPFKLLRRLAFYILSYSGTLSPGVILNMQNPIADAKGQLENIFVWYADEAPDCLYQLPSGVFGVFCVVGITEDECQFAESMGEYGCWSIQQVLRQTGQGQATDPFRKSVMNHENIGGILQSVRNYAENFRIAQP